MATVKITENNIPQVLDEVEKRKLRILKILGLKAEKYVKTLTPVDTGLLRNSITHAISGESPAISEYADNSGDVKGTYSGTQGSKEDDCVYIGTNVEYAPFVEFGENMKHTTGKAHFLRDGIQNHKDEFKQIIETEMKK